MINKIIAGSLREKIRVISDNFGIFQDFFGYFRPKMLQFFRKKKSAAIEVSRRRGRDHCCFTFHFVFFFTAGVWNLLLSHKHIYLHTRALSGQHSDPCALSALEPFSRDFSAARPRFVARLAPSDSPQSRGPCPRAGSALAAAVAQR